MKKIQLLSILFCLPMAMFAQIFGNINFKKGSADIVEKSLKNSIVIVQQQYLLEDTLTGKRYGSNGRNYYAESKNFALRTNEGLLLSEKVFTPWEQGVKNGTIRGNYVPRMCKSIVWSHQAEQIIADTLAEQIVLEKSSKIDSKFYAYHPELKSLQNGLAIDSLGGEKDGYVVWLRGNVASLDSVRVVAVKKEITLEKGSAQQTIVAPEGNDIMGGFFVTPQYVGIGQIQFALSGVVQQTENGFQIIFPFVEKNEQPQISEIVSIENNSEDKKSEQLAVEPKKSKKNR